MGFRSVAWATLVAHPHTTKSKIGSRDFISNLRVTNYIIVILYEYQRVAAGDYDVISADRFRAKGHPLRSTHFLARL